MARGLEHNEQWSCIVPSGPVGCLDWASLEDGPRVGLLGFQARVGDAIDAITEIVKKVVVSRRDFAVQGWRDRGHADLGAFRAVAEELTLLLDEIQLPPLTGDMLYTVGAGGN